jgi:dolichyl-phosphate beta-glucosyltransferase
MTQALRPPQLQRDVSGAVGRVQNWVVNRDLSAAPIELSVVIPAFNEERRLPATLVDLVDHLAGLHRTYEIVVVDDGSTDGTSDVVRKFERLAPSIRLIRLPRNSGKGYAVRVGILSCRGERVLFADADGSTPIAELARLERALDEGADIAFGSRALQSHETRVESVFHRKLLGRAFNTWIKALLLPGVLDTQCGFKLFNHRVAQFLFERQRSSRFSFDFEILYLARRSGLRMSEVPVNWVNQPGSKVRVVRDGIAMLRDAVRFRMIHGGVTPDLYRQVLVESEAGANASDERS